MRFYIDSLLGVILIVLVCVSAITAIAYIDGSVKSKYLFENNIGCYSWYEASFLPGEAFVKPGVK